MNNILSYLKIATIIFTINFSYAFAATATSASSVNKFNHSLYNVQKKIKNSLSFKVQPEGINKKISELLHLKDINLFFMCHMKKKGIIKVKLKGLNTFKQINSGLEESFLTKYYQIDLTTYFEKLSKMSFKQISGNKNFNYESNNPKKNGAIIRLQVAKKLVKKVVFLNRANTRIMNIKYLKKGNYFLPSTITQTYSVNKNEILKEVTTIHYKKYKNLTVIDFVNVQKIVKAKVTNINKIKFYSYKLK